MNCIKNLNCINLLEYFLLVSPPLNKVPIPRINTTPTAIKNIIDNAISFSPKPGIIKVLLSSTSNYLSIAIVDEGPGIKEPDMKRIFERFYSLREEDNKSHSGLGLNIAKQIVDAHEGSISVDNVIEENVIKGAKFIVNLPQVNINK